MVVGRTLKRHAVEQLMEFVVSGVNQKSPMPGRARNALLHTHSHVHTQGSEEDEDRLPLPSPSWEAQNPGSGINPLGTGTLPANAANLQQHLAKVPHAFTHMWKHGINQSLWNPLLGWPAPCHFEACGTKRHDRNLGTANTHMTGKGWLDRVLPSILSCLVLRQS